MTRRTPRRRYDNRGHAGGHKGRHTTSLPLPPLWTVLLVSPAACYGKQEVLKVYLISITIACSRLRRSPDLVCCVENALRAFSTQHTKFLRGEAARAAGTRGRRLRKSDTLLRRTKERCYAALQHLRGELFSHRIHNHAMTINEEGFWNTGQAVVYASRAIRVNYIGVGQTILLHEAQCSALPVLKIDADKDHPLSLCPLPLCLQEGSFLFTGVAPRRPEVDYDELPFKICQVKRLPGLFAQESQGKIRSRFAQQRIAASAVVRIFRGREQRYPEHSQQPNIHQADHGKDDDTTPAQFTFL